MRIESVSVRNFRGLRWAECTGLGDSPLVTVSGPNGAGKSLLFEAMTFCWRANRHRGALVVKSLVGPWDSIATVTLTLTFTDEEIAAAIQAQLANPPGGTTPASRSLTATVVISREGEYGHVDTKIDSEWGVAVWRDAISGMSPSIHLDYLPADRSIQRGEQAQVNPSMLSAEQTEGLREQVFNSFVQQRQILTLTGIQPFLASLDYLDMLADRERLGSTGDFDAITDPFFEATGKRIHRPRIDPLAPFGAAMNVETPSGALHGIDQLSSGEQEVLALMFYVRRLSATGGLLLVDEPELHLHPALQRSLFAVMEDIAARAQIWIITHSPKLVTAAPLGAVLHMTPTDGNDKNQLAKASDHEQRGELLSALGVHPVDALQSDSFVVVEGQYDSSRLSAILALPLSRSTIYVAGSAANVEATARTLSSGHALLPWIAIRDRDLMTDEDVEGLLGAVPGLFVWPSRTLENELLHPPLVSATFGRAGRSISDDEVTSRLRNLADAQREAIIADLVESELKRRHPYTIAQETDLIGKKRAFFEAQRASVEGKLGDLDDVLTQVEQHIGSVWDEQWFKLMDGKRTIGELLASSPFKTLSDYVSAVAYTVRDIPSVLPPGLAALRDRLHEQHAMPQ